MTLKTVARINVCVGALNFVIACFFDAPLWAVLFVFISAAYSAHEMRWAFGSRA